MSLDLITKIKEVYGKDAVPEYNYQYKYHVERKWKWQSFAEVVLSGDANLILLEGYRDGVRDTFVPTVTSGLKYPGMILESIPTVPTVALGGGLQLASEGVNTGFEGANTLSQGKETL